MEFRILGPLEVVEDGEPVALGTLKERLVLGVLLLHANECVSRERLIDDLWGEAPPPTARKAVNVYLSKLRKVLALDGDDPIETASGGYRLRVEPDQIDAGRMQQLLGEARESVSGGELEDAAERLTEALGLWRGPTLAGLQLESVGRDEVARLDELRLASLMDRIDCDLALGRQEQAPGQRNVLAAGVVLSGLAALAAVIASSAGASPHVVPDSLVRIDPRGKIVSVTQLGAEPQLVDVTPSAVWTNNLTENAVTRYDLRTHKVQ